MASVFSTVAVIVLFSASLAQADSWSARDYSTTAPASRDHAGKTKPLQFRFSHNYFTDYGNAEAAFWAPRFASMSARDALEGETGLHRYDAAFSYPLSRKGMNFNLGLNIRVFDGRRIGQQGEQSRLRPFREAMPMFYAAALFDLPFKGLQAGFEGRHSDSLANPSFDYKAKLSYEWAGGLGLEGGWQHQRYADDVLNQWQAAPISRGLFLDLRLKF